MFILYAIPVGIVIGLLAGGHLGRLGALKLRWVPLILLGVTVQFAIFTDAVGPLVGDAGPAIYVASTALVLIAVLRNIAVPGVALIALGAGCNLAAIVANGGWMPADPAAMESVGGLANGYTNSILVPDPALRPLTDLFALPGWLPFANVFSLGDVLIGIGVAATIALAMRASAAPERAYAGEAMAAQDDVRPAQRSLICVTADDDRFDSTRRAAMTLAASEDAELILYDWDAPTLFGDPLPSVWSADGTDTSVPDRLDEHALEAAGHDPIARQVIEAKAAGLSASAWLPTERTPDNLLQFARDHRAFAIVIPPEMEGLTDDTAAIRIVVA